MSSKGSNGMYADHDEVSAAFQKPKTKVVIADIEWYKPVDNPNLKPEDQREELYGKIRRTLLFVIDKRGKRRPKYVLKAYPFESGVFTRSNNYKKLFTHEDLEKVKEEAAYRLNYFVKIFLKED